MSKRGDIVLVQFPRASGKKGKVRPAVIVQCNRNNERLQNTIVVMVSGNTRFANTEPTHVLVDQTTTEGRGSGLRGPSAVKCENLFTLAHKNILRHVGCLSAPLQNRVDQALRASLALS
jgi:mRNA-degrading endonuclease toxin of MazEF toxin-antitoxin module